MIEERSGAVSSQMTESGGMGEIMQQFLIIGNCKKGVGGLDNRKIGGT